MDSAETMMYSFAKNPHLEQSHHVVFTIMLGRVKRSLATLCQSTRANMKQKSRCVRQ